MRGALNIAAKTRKLDVDNRLSLKLYYRTADNLLKQACVYREERNIIDLYILLLRFSSLVSETIPEHRDYRLYGGEKAEYKRKLLSVLTELESLKPEVQRQVDHYNSAFRKSASSSYSAQSSYSTPQADPGVAWPPYGRSQSLSSNNYDKYGARNTQSQPTWYGDSGSPGYNFASPAHNPLTHAYNSAIPSPYPPANVSNSARYAHQPPPNAYNSGQIEDRFSTLSLNIPRPKEETLSRHSFLGSTTQRPRRESAPVRVQYPSYVDASPIELPSLIQNWDAPSQLATVSTVSTSVASLDSLAEPVAWPNSGSSVSVDIAPQVSLIRQPSPPPVPAPVQTLQVALDTHDHPQTQIRPSEVADPRPGAGQPLDEDFGENKGPKHLHISTKMMDEFLRMAKANTSKNLETCGVLAGIFKKGTFYVSTLIIPKQEATSDSCQTVNEEEIFDSQDKRGLFQLGWIHTHPTQSCFMSSIDLHTHYSYQIMLQEAIAIVMAPTDFSRTYGIFRLADPGGVKVIQQCQRRGFHPHEEPPDGGPIYEHCAHVFMNPKLRFDVIDLRQS